MTYYHTRYTMSESQYYSDMNHRTHTLEYWPNMFSSWRYTDVVPKCAR